MQAQAVGQLEWYCGSPQSQLWLERRGRWMRHRGSKVELRPGGMAARGARARRCTDTRGVKEKRSGIEGRVKIHAGEKSH